MDIIVNDTNIFIDLHSIGLLDELCRLPYEIHTVDFVIAEIKEPNQATAIKSYIERGLIHVHQFSNTEVGEIATEHSVVSGNLSFTDISVCYYAGKGTYRLITGDRRLRNYAEKKDIEVHGILFLFDEMVQHDIITPEIGATKLNNLVAINIRLPKSEVALRIKEWSPDKTHLIRNIKINITGDCRIAKRPIGGSAWEHNRRLALKLEKGEGGRYKS